MLIYILITIVITQSYSLNTDHSHNKIVRRKTDYKVNMSMVDDDIEMDRAFIHLSNTTSKLSKYYKNNSHKTIRNTRLDGKYNTVLNPKLTNLTQDHDIVRTKIYQNNSSISSNYSYANSEEKSKTNHIVEIDASKTESEDHTNVTRTARDILANRVWSIVQIWLIIYIVLAIPLWCTIGRCCCCCLVCKCFKAQETIREAKLYAMWNPPGVLRKSTGDVIYTPSEREKEAYEELEHLIRTL